MCELPSFSWCGVAVVVQCSVVWYGVLEALCS